MTSKEGKSHTYKDPETTGHCSWSHEIRCMFPILHPMASMNYRGQVVVITDATSGFAQACGALLRSHGASLVLNYPPSSSSTRSLASAQNPGTDDEVSVVRTYHELDDAGKIIAAAAERYGTVHLLINNASFRSSGSADDLQSSTAWDMMQSSIINAAFKGSWCPVMTAYY